MSAQIYTPGLNTPESRMAFDAMMAGSMFGNGTMGMFANDAAVAGGMVFLQSELEKLDPKVREPLTSVTWARDMGVKTGGGWVDYTSTQFVDYGISGPDTYSQTANETTAIPIVQANLTKDYWRTFQFQNIMKVNFIDLQKAQTAGRSFDDLLDKGIRLNWNKYLDRITYQGPTAQAPGLINNPNIAASSLAAVGNLNGYTNTTRWAGKSPQQILNDVNALQIATWSASQYDVTGMANHILVPPADFALLLQPLTIGGVASGGSLLKYLLENNIGVTQGVELMIFPSRWCIGAGTGGVDRMVGYVNDEDRVYLDVTVPVSRIMTQASVLMGGAYLTLYAGQVGQVKFLYTQPAAYYDGI